MIDLNTFKYNAQFQEDRWILEHLSHLLPDKGVFVDFGAGNGIDISNTYGFEQIGWTGLCVDADPINYDELKEYRKTVWCGAVGKKEGEISFYRDIYNPDQSSTLVRTGKETVITVPSRTPESLLEEFGIGKIDLFSLDIEGTELEVLEAMDIEKHDPSIVLVEFKTPGMPDQTDNLTHFFADKPYDLVLTTFANLLFAKKEANV